MLHFSEDEFARRRSLVLDALDERGLGSLLIFAPESQYWLTGYDTFGYCFFQCLIFHRGGMVLLTRSADLRQAELTSNISDIRIWKDSQTANPAKDLMQIMKDLGLFGQRIGVETNTHGLTAHNWLKVESAFGSTLVEASDIVSNLRLTKSAEEVAYLKQAAVLADDALDAGLPLIQAGGSEADVLAAMQGAVFAGGGDYPGNPFIIGSGEHALLCRYASGRRDLDAQDQITLEWAGVYRHYHASMMRTVIVGDPRPEHPAMQDAAEAALLACEAALKPGAKMGDVFEAHRAALDDKGFSKHRLNACGYAQGARYAPSWMEHQMFYEGAAQVIAPNMAFFLHMILMDSDSGSALCLGRTSLVTETGSEPLSRHPLDMIVR